MKQLIIFLTLLILSPNFANAQKLSFDETLDYLKDKISHFESSQSVDEKEIEVTKNGTLEKKWKLDNGTQITTLNLKSVNILLRSENNLHTVYFKCKTNSTCTNYYFLKPDGTKTNYQNNLNCAFYFTTLEEAQKVKKAFLHLQSLIATKKDPFE